MPGGRPPDIHLRVTTPADVPRLFQFQLDPEANRLAGSKPRDLASFQARWEEILRDPVAARVPVARVIVAEGVVVGSINVFEQEGTDSIGYWIDRGHWGRGIATRAIALVLAETAIRPLFARVASHNAASQRALERNGFAAVSRWHAPESARSVAREMITLKLGTA